MEEGRQQGSAGWVAFATGFTVVLVLVSALLGAAAVLYAKRAGTNARKGWNLVPAPVAARKLVAGAVLSPGDIEVRELPEQFATASVAPASPSSLAGSTLTMPLGRREVLVHSAALPRARGLACVAAARRAATSHGDTADAEQTAFLAELDRRLAPGVRPADGGAP